LTFDEDFQERRQTGRGSLGQGLEGAAKVKSGSSFGLVHWKLSCASDEHEFIVLAYQGLYEGVTGVITQPVKGQQNAFAEQHMVNWAKLEARN